MYTVNKGAGVMKFYKRIWAVLSALCLLLGILAGCGTSQDTSSAPAQPTDAPTSNETLPENLPELDEELQRAQEAGLLPDTILSGWNEPVTFDQFAELLSLVIEAADANALDQWRNIAATAFKTTDPMERDDGILAIYEAACVLGLGDTGRAYWNQTNIYYDLNDLSSGYEPREDIFSNCMDIGLFEPNMGQTPEWDYSSCAMFYAMGLSSARNTSPLFAPSSALVKYDDPLSAAEAVKAAYRLYLAYVSEREGSFDNADYATDWSDSDLADAKQALAMILDSDTAIVNSDALVLGETYTGTAYYVSNSGNDANDGKSPENAWATLEKVENATLAYGDAVFFERGGRWYGRLSMQTGVTYSAYGTGAKPILTGSPDDAAQSTSWTYCGETVDGGKIWKYKEDVPDCGLILLDGHTVARKAYPYWDGQQYATDCGEAFTIENGLFADLMYFSDLNLPGYDLPVDVWQLGLTGPLYFRCDAGNPGDVFDTVELALIPEATATSSEGWQAIDNLNFRCYSSTGMDCCSHDHIVYQNCEVSWCGGAVKEYKTGIWEKSIIEVSGGGALMFGSDIVFRNNYIHDCESKGLAVVINGNGGDGHSSLERVNVLAEGNVVERCGSAIYLWTGLFAPDDVWKYEDIIFQNNYFINSAYGWRIHNEMWLNSGLGTVGHHDEAVSVSAIYPTGEVRIENNLFYRAAGCLVSFEGDDFSADAKLPTMSGNIYVQDRDRLLFYQRDEEASMTPIGAIVTEDAAQLEQCVREYIGDQAGSAVAK